MEGLESYGLIEDDATVFKYLHTLYSSHNIHTFIQKIKGKYYSYNTYNSNSCNKAMNLSLSIFNLPNMKSFINSIQIKPNNIQNIEEFSAWEYLITFYVMLFLIKGNVTLLLEKNKTK